MKNFGNTKIIKKVIQILNSYWLNSVFFRKGYGEMNMTEDYNKPGMATFIVVLAFNLIFFAFLSFVHEGVDDKKINKPAVNGEVKL